MKNKNQYGVTLLEVLISILILAVAGVSLLALISGNIRAVSDAQSRFFASLVADNMLEMAMIDENLPRNEITTGVSRLGHEEWRWVLHREKTSIEGFYRLSVDVSKNDTAQTLATAISFRTERQR